MKVWVVIKKGVYRHEIVGGYTTQIQAEDRARACANNDVDGWHEYEVGSLVLNADIKDTVRCGGWRKGE